MAKKQNIETLPMHLSLAMMNWLSSNAVWQLAKPDLTSWNPSSWAAPSGKNRQPNEPPEAFGNPQSAHNIWGDKRVTDNYLWLLQQPPLMEAIRNEAYLRTMKMMEGVDAYQDAVRHRKHEDRAPVCWQKGSARLLDYGGPKDSVAVLCIPSLINRHYILDLYNGCSLMEFFEDQTFTGYLMDWGEPEKQEKGFNCADYTTRYALEALKHVRKKHKGPVVVVGYCMGGLFALGLAQLYPELVDGLMLLATPWDFHAKDVRRLALDAEMLEQMEKHIGTMDTVPSACVQSVFHMVNPWHFQEKFSQFINLKNKDRDHFIAVEAWVNDGIPMARRVAKECLIDWPQRNTLAQLKWQIDGRTINPEKIDVPTLILAPKKDRIVTSGCTLPLAGMIEGAELVEPDSGHISMIVGKNAKTQAWQPMARWLKGYC